MRNELRQERFIGCDVARWMARLAIIDQTNPRVLQAAHVMMEHAPSPLPFPAGAGEMHAVAVGSEIAAWRGNDDDDDTDVWGDPIPAMQMQGSIAVIPIKGIIATGYPSIFQRFGYVDLDAVAEDVEAALNDPNCTAIVFRCDSPGGTLRALPEFAAMIAGANAVKPTAARIDGMGCSALYFAIAGCGVISGAPSAQMVNIGVYQVNWDMTKAYEAFGYRVEIFKSGKYKAAGYPGTGLSDDQKAEIQQTVEDLGTLFRDHVKACRPDADEANMQGQCFQGTKAMQLGFSDDDAPTFAAFMGRFQALLNAR